MLPLNWKQVRAKKLPDFCKKLFTTPQRYDIIIKQSKNRTIKKVVAVRNRQAALWGYSSAGRALDWQSRGQRFDPAYLHQAKRHPNGCLFCILQMDRIFAGVPLPARFSLLPSVPNQILIQKSPFHQRKGLFRYYNGTENYMEHSRIASASAARCSRIASLRIMSFTFIKRMVLARSFSSSFMVM